MMEADFDEPNRRTVRDVIARLGLADVCAFSISWCDCEAIHEEQKLLPTGRS